MAALFFCVSCGGGDGSDDTDGTAPEDISVAAEDFHWFPGVGMPSEEICSSPLLTPEAELPEGSYPEFLIELVNDTEPEEDGTVLRLKSDGTMSGNMGTSDIDIATLTKIHEDCEIGTRPPDFAGDWVYTEDNCLCMKLDIAPGVVGCLSLLETDCSPHETMPAGTEQ